MLALGLIFPLVLLSGQTTFNISGRVMDENDQPLSFATIALYNGSDSTFLNGCVSDPEGVFSLSHPYMGHYYVLISFVGFESKMREIELQDEAVVELGTIGLAGERIELDEAIVTADRIKAKQEVDKTTYFVNKQMEKASGTAMDLIKYIPGVHVDLFHHISLEGNNNILVLVNGMERDADFLSQLDPARIDKIEIRNHPGAEFRSDISGVIHIILKDENTKGVSGHLYTEIPVKRNELYAFPSANIKLNLKKVSLYASYDGELSYFDVEGTNNKYMALPGPDALITKTEIKQQEYWSHKFHYGLDYLHDERNKLSIYGFVNPYSSEFDGEISLKEFQGDSLVNSWNAHKDDTDKNLMAYGTAFYKHLFRSPGTELSVDLNYYRFKGQTDSWFTEENGDAQENSSQPIQHAYSARLDLRLPLTSYLILKTGLREMRQEMSDAVWSSFQYKELISAGYASVSYSGKKMQVSGGLRMEHANRNLEESQAENSLNILPYVSATINATAKGKLGVSYGKSIQRPSIYQLNPNLTIVDPYTTYQGNSGLESAIHNTLSLDYSTTMNNNFISMGTFYEQSSNCIENLVTVSEELQTMHTMQNLGSIEKLGIKLLGSVKLLKNVSFNPFIKAYGAFTRGNELAREHGIEDRNRIVLESGFSMSALFKKDFVLSTMFKYNSSRVRIQGSHLEDMLYFISLEKTFKDKFMIGLTSALPFSKEFTYRGYETMMADYREYSEDNLQLSLFPVWIKIKYTFSTGRKTKHIERSNDFTEASIKKGLFK
jgi:hypothetical protein